jgi:hypothetical protein
MSEPVDVYFGSSTAVVVEFFDKNRRREEVVEGSTPSLRSYVPVGGVIVRVLDETVVVALALRVMIV